VIEAADPHDMLDARRAGKKQQQLFNHITKGPTIHTGAVGRSSWTDIAGAGRTVTPHATEELDRTRRISFFLWIWLAIFAQSVSFWIKLASPAAEHAAHT
jgi:hypothetical protein